MPRWVKPAAWLVVTVSLYACLSVLYPLAAGLNHPRHLWAQLAGANLTVLVAHGLIYAGLFLAFALALRHADALHMSERWIWACFALSSFALLFGSPGESSDVFDYLFRGRMLAEYDSSPLNTAPVAFKNMPFHRYITWSGWVDAYGPLWEYASGGMARLVRLSATPEQLAVVNNQTCDNQPAVCTYITRYVTAYRLLAIAATVICGVLLRWIVPAEQRPTTLTAFLGNPLTLMSTALGAHNDALMLMFVLAGLALFTAAKSWWRASLGLLMLVLAAHVKLTALVFVPVVLVWLWRRDGVWRVAVSGVLAVGLGIGLSWLLYQPLGGWATLTKNLYERSILSANSIGELLYLYIRFGLGVERYAAQIPVGRAMMLLFAVLAGGVLLRWVARRPAPTTAGLGELGAVVALLYLAIGSFWFQSWYVIWVIALAAMSPDSGLNRRAVPVFSGAVLFAAVGADYARHGASSFLAGWQVSALFVACMLIPLCIEVLARWRAATRTPAAGTM